MGAVAVTVGVDVGGTKMLAGIVETDGRVTTTVRCDTPGARVAVRHVEDSVVETVLEAAGGSPLAAVGVAAAGLVDAAGQRVAFAPHLPWRGEPLRKVLEERFGCPVTLDNDANCAAVAEWTCGAARGADSMLMITVGTGIGGAFLLGGQVLRGANGMAGEFGHMQMVADGLSCPCGSRGCWEQYCSGGALVRAGRALMSERTSVLDELCGGRPERLTGAMVSMAAEAGDGVAQEALMTVGDWLGIGVANLVAALDPGVVVIGGGVAEVGERMLEPARQALNRSLVGAEHRQIPAMRVAHTGARAGLIGAGLLAGQRRRTASDT